MSEPPICYPDRAVFPKVGGLMTTMRRHSWLVGSCLLLVLASSQATAAPGPRVAELVARDDVEALRGLGAKALPEMVRLYQAGDTAERTRIANLFYQLSWKSPDAVNVLIRDVRTQDPGLRIAVQYALGRVSDDPRVVDALLQNMMYDANPYFRDKAACALAYDQVHLSEAEKVRLYEGLIQALASEEQQIQGIAILALRIHTGQTKGFHPIASSEKRQQSIVRWKQWLAEYKENL
jgi:HEAT repeat protein